MGDACIISVQEALVIRQQIPAKGALHVHDLLVHPVRIADHGLGLRQELGVALHLFGQHVVGI